LEVSNLG